jgi:hypothetical protein
MAKKSTKLNKPVLEVIPHSKTYINCEWCFQFDKDEPRVFAAGSQKDTSEPLHLDITIKNTSESNIEFSYNGRTFRIFARELSEAGANLIKK